jgi:hypothetical protein
LRRRDFQAAGRQSRALSMKLHTFAFGPQVFGSLRLGDRFGTFPKHGRWTTLGPQELKAQHLAKRQPGIFPVPRATGDGSDCPLDLGLANSERAATMLVWRPVILAWRLLMTNREYSVDHNIMSSR